MHILKIAAFSEGGAGGNPAGVLVTPDALGDAEMLSIAAGLGFSETAFAVPTATEWRVRYFSPEAEVPFCGHATIALGAALARAHGDGVFPLALNNAKITVEGRHANGLMTAALQSPPTRSSAAPERLVSEVLELFGYSRDDLNPRLAPGLAHGGSDHLVLCLKSRARLAAMKYDFESGGTLMRREGFATISLLHAQGPQLFHSRNPFAFGGVYEDPATGAAAAALAGYLRDIDWPHDGCIDIIQGEDMGMRSRIKAEFTSVAASSIRVSGAARMIDEAGQTPH
ncbi:MAG TPA: PhzF family phenazine biosynthesis protein [Ramlibacter sp.]|nr:PhzF family phenazine biosynthesis protein [Ramlibacter sp.]